MSDPFKQIAIRLPLSIVDRIDAHFARIKAENPGMSVSRSDAMRALLLDGLRAAEQPQPKGKPAK